MSDQLANQPSRRVVITGMGLIGPFGNELDSFTKALAERQSGVSPFSEIPKGLFPIDAGAEAKDFSGKIDGFGKLDKDQKRAIRKGLKVMCRECQMGVAAAQRALAHAEITPGTCDPKTSGVSFGSDYMITTPDEFSSAVAQVTNSDGEFEFDRWAVEGLPQMSPLWLLKFLPNMPASHIAIYNDFQGPSNSITVREASADLSIGEAYRIIAEGRAEILLTGATGTRLHLVKMIHCTQQTPLSTESRPFDSERTGMVPGEGAGSIIIESLESAQTRGATIYGEIIGRSASAATDRNLVANPKKAFQNVLNIALKDARLQPNQLGHIQAHGLGTPESDKAEAAAIESVFGPADKAAPVTTIKGNTGNLGAGSGAIEIIAGLLSLERGKLFPVLGHVATDPECPIRVVTDDETASGDSFLHQSITPQGQAAAIVVSRFVA
jgi:3-oxoacyl-[acyl-carrier-protein] synthase II